MCRQEGPWTVSQEMNQNFLNTNHHSATDGHFFDRQSVDENLSKRGHATTTCSLQLDVLRGTSAVTECVGSTSQNHHINHNLGWFDALQSGGKINLFLTCSTHTPPASHTTQHPSTHTTTQPIRVPPLSHTLTHTHTDRIDHSDKVCLFHQSKMSKPMNRWWQFILPYTLIKTVWFAQDFTWRPTLRKKVRCMFVEMYECPQWNRSNCKMYMYW